MRTPEGTILYVGLRNGRTESKPLEEQLRLNFVGGRGISTKILFDKVPPEITPLSPRNILISSCDPLSGTLITNAPHQGERIDPDRWEEMLDEYYSLRGWDTNGIPTREKLLELG